MNPVRGSRSSDRSRSSHSSNALETRGAAHPQDSRSLKAPSGAATRPARTAARQARRALTLALALLAGGILLNHGAENLQVSSSSNPSSLSLSGVLPAWAGPTITPQVFEFHSPNDGEAIDLFTTVVIRSNNPDGVRVKVFSNGEPVGDSPVSSPLTTVLLNTARLDNGVNAFEARLYSASGACIQIDWILLDVSHPQLEVTSSVSGGSLQLLLTLTGLPGDLGYQVLTSPAAEVTPSPAYGLVLPINPDVSSGLMAGPFPAAYDGTPVTITTTVPASVFSGSNSFFVAVATTSASGRWQVTEAIEISVPSSVR